MNDHTTAAEQVVARLDSYTQDTHLKGIQAARERARGRKAARRQAARSAVCRSCPFNGCPDCKYGGG